MIVEQPKEALGPALACIVPMHVGRTRLADTAHWWVHDLQDSAEPHCGEDAGAGRLPGRGGSKEDPQRGQPAAEGVHGCHRSVITPPLTRSLLFVLLRYTRDCMLGSELGVHCSYYMPAVAQAVESACGWTPAAGCFCYLHYCAVQKGTKALTGLREAQSEGKTAP